jgi:ankyrin repeat protein
MGARPDADSLGGPCETQGGSGLAYLLELGCSLDLSHVALILQTYSRNPEGKHQCLELAATHGIALPDTPPLAIHRGRIDLLERHTDAINERFSHADIYPPALGCDADHSKALHGTPLAGGGLLHLAVDNDEIEIAQWLLAHGADVNLRAALDADGFGGHTPLFACVVSQPYRVGRHSSMARLLLDHGADPTVRASLRKRLRYVEDETMQEYRDVTPLAWGEQFHDQDWVDRDAMRLIADSRETP